MTTLTNYIGTKVIQAAPEKASNGAEGYRMIYANGYYTSWSPKQAFEEAYRKTDSMTFGDALVMLKAGHRVARAGWNGKGMWLALSGDLAGRETAAELFWNRHNADHARAQGGSARVLPSITMKTATGEILMGWLASQTDMLAEDWQVVE